MNSKRHKLTLSIKLLSLTHSPGVASPHCVLPHGHLEAWGPQEPRGFCAEEGQQRGEEVTGRGASWERPERVCLGSSEGGISLGKIKSLYLWVNSCFVVTEIAGLEKKQKVPLEERKNSIT